MPHTRILSILAIAALTLAGSCAAFAATRAETTTYVDGNLASVSPNTGGTLLLSDNAMYFRTGLSTVAVLYASISHAELGATKETSHDVPVYKFWALHKRSADKTQTQCLIVNFKNDAGEDKSMTLELAKVSASGVLSLIQSRNVKDAAPEKKLIAAVEPAAPEETLIVPVDPAATSPEPPEVARNTTSQAQSASQSEPKALSKKDAKLAKQESNKKDAEKTAAAKADKPTSWWGDDYWKTTRNSEKWSARVPLSPANEQR